jgi:hypothetical protein
MANTKLVLSDIDHWDLSWYINDFLDTHRHSGEPVTIVCGHRSRHMELAMRVIYQKGCSSVFIKRGGDIEISVI